MEIKTTFETIIGILMLITVILATVVLMGGLANVTVSECMPAEYTAQSTNAGAYCGLDINHQRQYCINNNDKCISLNKNICCPTSDRNVKIVSGQCCNITRV